MGGLFDDDDVQAGELLQRLPQQDKAEATHTPFLGISERSPMLHIVAE